MSRSDRAALVLLVVLAAGLALGVWRLFALRFTAGDMFPAYSSLRADPLGTKILFESLGRAGLDAERGFRRLAHAGAGQPAGTTVFVVGASRGGSGPVRQRVALEERFAGDLAAAAANGARIVIAFHPESQPAPAAEPEDVKPAKGRPAGGGKSKPIPPSLEQRWGFRYAFAALRPEGGTDAPGPAPAGGAGRPDAADAVEDPALWHSTLVFAGLDEAWRILGTRRGRPVHVERDYGAGSIVLLADSYPLSNEAMLRDRRTDLLSRVVGANRRVLFDETHLGVLRDPGGIVSLMTKYRLGGLALGLAVLAALALWRGAMPFLPPVPEAAEGEAQAQGRGSAEALVDLVRRNIPAAQLPFVCLKEWARTFPERRRSHPDRYQRALEAAERFRIGKTTDAAGAFRRIARILKGA